MFCRISKYFLSGVFCCLLHNAEAFPNLDTLKIKGESGAKLSKYYLYIEDKTRGASVYNIIDSIKLNRFQSHNDNSRIFYSRYTNSNFWLLLPVMNDTTVSLPLSWNFYNNNLGFVLYDATDLAHPAIVDSIASYQTLKQRNFPVRMPAFRFELAAKTYKLLLLKVYKLNADGVYFPTDLSTTEDVLLWENKLAFALGQFVGYFTFTFFFNIFLGILLRAKIHIWHAFYIVTIIIFGCSEYMYDVLYFPDWIYPYFNKLPIMLFLLISQCLGLMVLQIFTHQKENFPQFGFINYFKIWLVAISASLLIATIFLPFTSTILTILRITADITFLIGILVWVTYIVWGCVKKNKTSFAYLAASVCLIAAYADYIYVIVFGHQLFYFKPGNIIIGLTIEITVLTFLFAYNISRERSMNFLKLKETNQKNVQLAQSLLTIQEDERKRVAADLHDGLGATLGALKLFISNSDASNKGELMSTVNKANTEMKDIVHDLLPSEVVENGLYVSLIKFKDILMQQNKTQFNFVLLGDDRLLSENTAVQTFRIINEAVNNIVKHALASRANIQIIIDEKSLQIIIEDNGIGIQQSNDIFHKGIGLKNISTRTSLMAGNLHIDSSENGTTIIINVPINNDEL